jgi:hypothetical protein
MRKPMQRCILLLTGLLLLSPEWCCAFVVNSGTTTCTRKLSTLLFTSSSSSSEATAPQVLSSGYSSNDNLSDAIHEATELAIQALPEPQDGSAKIDLAVISVSSLYDGTFSPSLVVPSLLDAASSYGSGVKHIIGSTAGGIVSSLANTEPFKSEDNNPTACVPVEIEGSLGVSVTLCILPEVTLKTFHVHGDDVPDDYGRVPADTWKRAVGLSGFGESQETEKKVEKKMLPYLWYFHLLPFKMI